MGANLDWRYLLDGQNQITIGGHGPGAALSADDLDRRDFQSLHDQRRLDTCVTPDHRRRPDADGRSGRCKSRPGGQGTRRSGASRHAATLLFFQFGDFFTAGFQRGDYSQFNTSYGIERQDELSDAALGLVWSLPDRWSVRPMIAYTKTGAMQTSTPTAAAMPSVVLRGF